MPSFGSLQLGLAITAGVVLAGLIAHGAWQARSARPRRASPVQPATRRDPGEGDAQSVFNGLVDAPEGATGDALDGLDAAAVSGKSFAAARSASPLLPKRYEPRIDALIDAIVTLRLDAAVAGEGLHAHLPATRRAGSKPFLIEAHNVRTQDWEPPRQGERYDELQVGVQLANRLGALNAIEFSEFVQIAQRLSDAIGAVPEVPDMQETVARARELDAFASTHDAQLAVHLQARTAAWSVAYLQQHAARHGFVPGAVAGRLVLPAQEEGAPPVLLLSFDAQAALADDPQSAALRDVTLSFDVPQTDPAAEPFIAWQASAQALSLGMDAELVDDHGQRLSAEGFATIGAELGALYRSLAERDLAAGSAAARRLFS